MAPASFGDMGYWDERYEKRKDFFDWLQPAEAMDSTIKAALNASPRQDPKILHLGCGTSTLSFDLRKLVRRPELVHNVDFSKPAIDLCRKREAEIFGEGREGNGVGERNGSDPSLSPGMKWSVVDLLSSEQIWQLRKQEDATATSEPFDVIVDKSTCDSLCCGEDVVVRLPYKIPPRASDDPSAHSGPNEVVPSAAVAQSSVYPLNLLAVHLAYLSPPGAHWVALSFSKGRFDDFDPSRRGHPNPVLLTTKKTAGPLGEADRYLANPGELWELKSVEEILVPEDVNDKNAGQIIHRPAIFHYLSVLVRTDTRFECK